MFLQSRGYGCVPPGQSSENYRHPNADWIKFGAAWPHSDGKGYTIDLDALPVGEFNGRLTLRAIEPSNREPSAA